MNTASRQTTDLLRDLTDVFAQHDPFRIRYEPNELICQAGSYAAGVYLVTAGLVRETYVDTLAKRGELWVDLLTSGDLIGSEFLLPNDDRLHRTSCRAVSTVSLLFLERSAFETAVEAHDVLRRFLTVHLAERSFSLIRVLWRSRLRSVERINALLLDLVPVGKPTADGHIALPAEIDLRLLAGLSHLSRRKASQACQSLPGVEWDNGQLVLSPEELGRQGSQET